MDRGAWWATVHRVTKSQTQNGLARVHAHSFTLKRIKPELLMWAYEAHSDRVRVHMYALSSSLSSLCVRRSAPGLGLYAPCVDPFLLPRLLSGLPLWLN